MQTTQLMDYNYDDDNKEGGMRTCELHFFYSNFLSLQIISQ